MTGPRDPCTSVLRGSASGNREKLTSVLAAECVVVSAYLSEPAACCLRGPWKEGLTDSLEVSQKDLPGDMEFELAHKE